MNCNLKGGCALCGGALFMSLIAAPTALAQDFRYALFDMGLLGGDDSEAHAVNNRGIVVGISNLPGSLTDFHAVRWENGVLTDLEPKAPPQSSAEDINEGGTIVGFSSFDGHSHAAMWLADGSRIDLGTLGGDGSTANAINELGQVVGFAEDEFGEPFGVVWDDGQVTILRGLATATGSPNDINDLGQIVGSARDDGNDSHAVLWENGNITDLGLLGTGDGAIAFGINNSSQIVGLAEFDAIRIHAFLWQNGQMTDIHNPDFADSAADAINESGQVAGYLLPRVGGPPSAFLWENGVMTDIGPLCPPHRRGNLEHVWGLNDWGMIVGSDRVPGGDFRGVIAVPVHPEMTITQPSPRRAGQVNTLTATGCTPGASITFYYGTIGGGRVIPGCDLQDAALQIENPHLAGTAVADVNGVATMTAFVRDAARNIPAILLQAVEPSNCKQSQLIVTRFQ